ncbi:MAG TPA: hypothetical protein VHA07_12070 [Devosia sp.]|nr:hypothetical protein [Devosia sp.]
MSPLRTLTAVLLGTAGACCWIVSVDAADLIVDQGTIVQPDTQLPAVSGINGKWEFDPGLLTGGGLIRGAGSLSVPLGDRFGLQGDVMGTWTSTNGFIYSGALHAFTRDPERYLAGLTGGIVVSPQATLAAFGPEGELYLDNFSLEAWGGFANLNYVDPAMLDKTGVFAIGDLAYYATPDWRFTVGGSYVLGDLSVHGGTEYMFHGLGMPLSATADARLHNNGSYTFTVGLKGYFGGSDDGKSLIDRQRQDDPPNRAIDLFTAAGSQMFDTPPAGPTYTDPEQSAEACLYFGGTPIYDGESNFDFCNMNSPA